MSSDQESGERIASPGSFVGVLDVEREACFELLEAANLGRLAVTLPNGQPVIRPVNYSFDRPSQSIVFRTGEGSKFQALIRSKRAAFEVDGIDPVERTGWSVIVQGVTEEVTDPIELERLGKLVLDPWAPGDRPHWFRVRAFTVTGRRVFRVPPLTPSERD
jgi:nitroimidazol reductase NimA-like FMN-containing flavoprotein (pyridoxamine 5'-phosphate oxidase superfamily)